MANNKKLQELDGMNGVPLVDADIVHGVTQTGGQPTDKKITVKELSDHAETHVKANAAHASEQEDTDQAKLASVGKVQELIGEGRRVVPVTSTPTALDQDVVYLVHGSDEDITFDTETVPAGATAHVYYDGSSWVVVEYSNTLTSEAIMSAISSKLNTTDEENVEDATIPTTEKVQEMIESSGTGSGTGGGTSSVEIIDNLESIRTDAALSAKQGKELNETKLGIKSEQPVDLFTAKPTGGGWSFGGGNTRITEDSNHTLSIASNTSTSSGYYVSKFMPVTPGIILTLGLGSNPADIIFFKGSVDGNNLNPTSNPTSNTCNTYAISVNGQKINHLSASKYIKVPMDAAYMILAGKCGSRGEDNRYALVDATHLYETDGRLYRYSKNNATTVTNDVTLSNEVKSLSRLSIKEPIIGKNIVECFDDREELSDKDIDCNIGEPFAIKAETGKTITGRIPIIGGAVYYVHNPTLSIGGEQKASVTYSMHFFDADDVYVGNAVTSRASYYLVTPPGNAVWLRLVNTYANYKYTDLSSGVIVTFGEYKYYSGSHDMDVSGLICNVLGTDINIENKEGKVLSDYKTLAEQLSKFNSKGMSTIPTHELNLKYLKEVLTSDHQYDYWKGKKIFVDGDSISHYIGNQPFWQQHVANNLRMRFITKSIPINGSSNETFDIGDRGYAGSRLCPVIENGADTSPSSEENQYSVRQRCLIRRLAEGYYNNVSADLFIIFIGTNDWAHGSDISAKLGSISDAPFNPNSWIPETTETGPQTLWDAMDEGDKDGAVNLKPYAGITFYGCLKYLVEWFIINKPKADLVLLTPIKREDNIAFNSHTEKSKTHTFVKATSENNQTTYSTDTESVTLAKYADAIKEVGKLYGVPVCDLFSNCFMNPSTALGQDADYPSSETQENIDAGTQLTYYFDYYQGGNAQQRRDTTHPGPEGHKKIGRLVTGFLKSLC